MLDGIKEKKTRMLSLNNQIMKEKEPYQAELEEKSQLLLKKAIDVQFVKIGIQ